MLLLVNSGGSASSLSIFFIVDASYNSITYGNLQKISKPSAKCEDPDETQALPNCNEHVSISCGDLHLYGHMETSLCNGELVARSWEVPSRINAYFFLS